MSFTLAVDIDGVLADYTTAVARAGGLAPTHGPTTYDMLGGEWFPDKDAWRRAHTAVTGDLRELEIIDSEAPASLHQFRDAGMGIIYVTAREGTPETPHASVRTDTRDWLECHGFPDPDRLVMTRDKAGVDYDALVDDAPHNLAAALRAGRVAVAFDQSYNRNCECSCRVQSIPELVDRLLYLQG